jgi:pimeloyl-ACP methyl ester carboxylesterase
MGDVLLETGLMHYEAVGRGKPLLFLHDWIGSSRYWIPIMMDIASAYRSYALDFWGFGASDRISTFYTIDHYLEQVVMFITQMGISHVPLVGHGLGGIVGVMLAAEFPNHISQVLAVSLPLTEACVSRALSNFQGSDNPAKSILGRRLKAYEEVAMEAAKIDSQAVIQSLDSTMALDLLEALEDVAMPMLLIYGKHDPLVDPPDDEVVTSLEDNVRTLVLKRAQHYPMLEDATTFKRFLLRFLMYQDSWDAVLGKQERWIWGP